MWKTKKHLVFWIVIILIVTVAGLAFLFHKGKDLKNTDEFVKELKSRNCTIESIEDVSKDKMSWFSGNQKMIKSSNIELSVFEFSSEEEALDEASKISKDGFKIETPSNAAGNTQNGGTAPLAVYIGWGDNPHFYRSGNLIVLYCGTNLKVQYDLNRILGSQFAGFKWYIPGRKH
jgi:hypothetical protein